MTGQRPSVRVARASETVALHELWIAMPDRADWAPAEGAHTPLLTELDVLVADRRVWAAYDGSDPLGVAAAGEIDSALFLTVLGVVRNARGNGLGSALLKPIVDFGRSAQYPALVAVARRHSAGAYFLRQSGFIDMAPERLSGGLAAVIAHGGSAGRRVALARPL